MLSRSSLRSRLAKCTALAITTFVFAGCGSSGGSDDSGAEVTKLKLAVLPLTASAPLYIADKEGYFADEGLDVEFIPATGAAAGIPGLVSGEVQIGAGNLISVMQAAEQGINLSTIAANNQAATSLSDTKHVTSAVLARADSGISEPKDLEGKTIAVNTLNGLGDATIKASLEAEGVDVKSLKFTELAFPDMLAAISAKRVDAIWEVEPFVTAAAGSKADLKPIIYPFEQAAPGLPLGVFFTTKEFAADNPTTVKRFKTALDKATEVASADEAKFRDTVPTFTEISEDVAAKMALPELVTSFSRASLTTLAEIAEKFGLIKSAPDLDALFGVVIQK